MRKALVVLIISLGLLTVSLNAQSPKPSGNTVCIALQSDGVSPETCRKWYVVYKGMYLYLHELDGQGTNDFDQIFTKLREVRDKIQPAKGSKNFTSETQKILDRYSEVSYKPETRTDFAEEILYIADGIKQALESMEK
jgi:hypothetical protein